MLNIGAQYRFQNQIRGSVEITDRENAELFLDGNFRSVGF
jgi:hypothetical protein